MQSANVVIPFYSSYGTTHRLAEAVETGAASVPGSTVRLRRIPEIPSAGEAMSGQNAYDEAQADMADIPRIERDDLRWADGIIWGTPTRFGNMAAQVKQFIDTLGGMWFDGELEGKATGVFVSTGSIHGGHETTVLTSLVPLIHLGMVFVGVRYSTNDQIMTTEGVGGSPYGPSTMPREEGGVEAPMPEEVKTARSLGERVTRVSARLQASEEAPAMSSA
ncbi:NAD(P)H:quinone oxidoreductase [Salinibacter ruber]|jgi:NAD(P)H dehydrogenase (quinone)|uniref:NAD(P)H dehydrogenase (Quinone) n=1 Tax=Salinibacter ruber TaxID=146919 RepID=A0A9X2ZSQ5_9BACT|nr:NAD(P)H:quinone oxidoreductase [Salinibacter ruber]MCS3658548.1 NAD(P)H dehydrogenase (quinone) [Salinibacter ruber]MCS3951817.1 NAD(P)H dehydrogenase (quinone) [Salinibacter ruber]MCS4118171.1 NAD(P)H dehydrogenase (quinone) [Salinibacter ruber]MCS4154465.1 NAD(P)H dehydrogenase (quinone) [Salinibacter ruber]MCS4172094.1 NAD(P)H dehydrogenase (quinone) [Salinibacter ruber]